MKFITKLKKSDFSKKTQLWHDANLTAWEAEEIVKEMVLSMPGCYKLHDRQYGTNLVDKIYETYGYIS